MSKIVALAESQLREAILASMGEAVASGGLPAQPVPDFGIEIPSDRAHGDLSSNAAMVSAKAFRLAPRMIAEIIKNHLVLDGTYFDSAEVAGPGFLNFTLSPAFYAGVVSDILEQGAQYGRSDFGKGQKVMVEFVSANPTGPMHMGNARGGALGDCLAAVLEAAGYDVWREFYVNDAGNQIEKFGISLEARYIQHLKGEDAIEFPEDAYHGDDIREHAANFAEKFGDRYLEAPEEDRRAALVNYALPLNIKRMQSDLEKYRITYDCWFKESTLHQNGELEDTIRILTERGLTYEKEGALWYKASEFGGEKDEVLIRANGHPTYFAADIAYHRNKFGRGFDICIDVWGADHHGHVARMKGAMDALGLDGSRLKVVLIQLVRLMRGGDVVRMSKRSGKAIQLADLLDEVPVDAARFFFNQREANTQMDFDLELAVEKSSQNPVYYVQYAHARICSIFRNLAAEGVFPRDCTLQELAALATPDEKELIRHLAGYTGELVEAAKTSDPARITRYCLDLAALFHKFYNSCRVKGEDEPLMQARLALCAATRHTLHNALTLLKIDTPESM
ncbi:MAG: arginine--tRNA ligase [Clostridiales bacterium]|jgi:arginyl-tRNA synthetase|nr:arginine--tRNA ligase [Clostridiales bacterium]